MGLALNISSVIANVIMKQSRSHLEIEILINLII